MKTPFVILRCLIGALVFLTGASDVLAQGIPITFTNPTPADSDYFGFAVATVGTNRLVIGAYYDDIGTNNAGVAHVYNTNGTLLVTITNPAPVNGDHFGNAVAGLGTDRVVIGAHQKTINGSHGGAAYLYSTSGNLLASFVNPTPADNTQFGSSVAVVGTSRVLIGAAGVSNGVAQSVGKAYLFNTNGTLLVTFTNPTPVEFDQFGRSVAAVGTDFVVIGASGFFEGPGKAFLFSTNGSLITTFTNPTPADGDVFGVSVAGVGNNRVLIGASQDDTAADNAGIAYLFNTNGTRLVTFNNPTPADGDGFGVAVAAIGTDRVIIGAIGDDTSANGGGAAYVFSTNGTLLNTFTNPTTGTFENFGNSLAAGSDWVLIGVPYSNKGLSDAGAAYLYNLSPQSISSPTLRTFLTTSNAIIAWPTSSSGFQLQQNTNVTTANWSDVTNAVSVVGQENQVGITPAAGNKFYRLFHQ